MSYSVCSNKLWGGWFPLPSNQMCAGEIINGGKDTCSGDSGGPLYDRNAERLVGITSWGSGCGTTLPAGYARIADQFEWIKETVCAHHNPVNAPSYCIFEPTICAF